MLSKMDNMLIDLSNVQTITIRASWKTTQDENLDEPIERLALVARLVER